MSWVPSIADPFDGFELPPGVSPDQARWILLNKRVAPLFPKYLEMAGPEVLQAEKEINSKFTFVSRRLHLLDAAKDVSDVDVSSKSEARKFFSFNSSRQDEFDYIDRRVKQGQVWENEHFSLKFSYAGFHWKSPINLLVALSNSQLISSPEFRSISNEISQKYITIGIVKKLSHQMSNESFENALQITFGAMLKNKTSLCYRMYNRYRLELFEKYGYADLTDLEKYSGMLYSPELLPELDGIIKRILTEYFLKIDTQAANTTARIAADLAAGKTSALQRKPLWFEDTTTMKPNTDLEPLKDDEIDIHIDRGGEIVIYKIVPDTVTTDTTRLISAARPYASGVVYDPPILRGVSLSEQPYMVVVANSEVNPEETFGDTPAMRKTITCDMITRSLDYAARNGLPLPPMGTEIFTHFADGTDSNKILENQFPLAVYSRKRRHKFLIPFPEYSYGVFTIASRFSILDSPIMTWDSIKDYIVSSEEAKNSLQRRDNSVFFKGAAFSHSFIREHLSYFTGKRIADPKKPNETLIPPGKFLIDIPDIRGKVFTQPITVPQMGRYRFLLDLPGYGMWSTRLKFIILTKSIVIRVMFVGIEYNNEMKKWNQIDPNDIWETYFDCIAPFDIVETIIGEFYMPSKSIDSKTIERLNKESRNRILTQIGRIYRKYNSNLSKAAGVVARASGIINELTDDKISDYIYRITMKMAEMYGHIRDVNVVNVDTNMSEIDPGEIRIRCPPGDPLSGNRERCLPE